LTYVKAEVLLRVAGHQKKRFQVKQHPFLLFPSQGFSRYRRAEAPQEIACRTVEVVVVAAETRGDLERVETGGRNSGEEGGIELENGLFFHWAWTIYVEPKIILDRISTKRQKPFYQPRIKADKIG
jgi:hypothetical protein